MNFQQAFLSVAERARLNSWAVEIAEEARGAAQDAGNGDWRVGDSRALIIHPGALFYDFTSGAGGRGALALIALLHNVDAGGAGKLAHAWLAAHQGEGRLAHGVADDEDAARSADDAGRIAEIETMWKRRQPIEGTRVEVYLTSRKLTSCDALGWLPDLRGGEGAMIAGVTDPAGTLVAIQLTYITANGCKSTVKPQRMTWRGPHDWNRRGVVWCSAYDGSGALHVCEGVEDALSLTAAGVSNVVATLGIGRLGRIVWPLAVRKLVIVRDDDPPGSPGDNTLYRGVTRQRGMGLEVHVTVRPKVVAPGANVPLKDVNDLHRHNPELTPKLLNAPYAGPEDLSAEARNAVLDEASYLSGDDYERARKATSTMLGHSRVKTLDEARAARIAERIAAASGDEEAEEEAWPDPVTDIGEVLDAAAIEVGRYIKASPTAIDAVVLWCAGAHVLQRNDLRIIISPRLYIQSPVPNCGKTTLLEIVMAATPRAEMVSSASMSGLFRETHVRKPTWGFDEFDQIVQSASPEHLAILSSGHRKTSAYVIRTTKMPDGQLVTERFSTFTAMACSGMKKLSDAMTSRCIIVSLQRAGAHEKLEHLVNGASDKLTELRRKLARWARDVTALPVVNRPPELCNRLGDNWYVIRQIGKLAGEAWYKRAMAAALTPAMAADTNITLALLDAIWRAFDETKRSRMLTSDLLTELLDMDEGRWREAHHGKAITPYFLRDNLESLLPPEPEKVAPRRWREGSAHQQYGYDVLHFKDAFQRYLGKGLPGQVADGSGRGSGAKSKPDTESEQEPAADQTSREKTKKHPPHRPHPSPTHETSGNSNTYAEADVSGMPEADQAQKTRKSSSARKGPADGDPPQASASEKHEEKQATPADETDEADEADMGEGRARVAPDGARPKGATGRSLPKGAVGRKPRKAM